MKKIIFLLAASVFCFQIAGLSQTRVGLSGGVAVASQNGNASPEGDARAGFIGGIVLETSICKDFSFRPSISYIQKGQGLFAGTVVDKKYLALRYAEFNADFLYHLGGFFIGAGPSIAFNLPSKQVSVTDDVKTTSIVHFGKEVGMDLRGTDWGANFVAGWQTKGGLFLNINYNKGFRNLVPEGATGTLKNSYFGAQLGVYLNNGIKK